MNSLYFNIWYHLALAYYLKQDFEKALHAYEMCMKVSEINDKVDQENSNSLCQHIPLYD